MGENTLFNHTYSFGKERIVNAMVLVSDFALLNITLLMYFLFAGDLLPDYFHFATKITVLLVNLSMCVAEYFYRSIIYSRIIKIQHIVLRTAKLVAVQVVMSFVLLRLMSDAGNYFSFMITFGLTGFAVLLVSRILERALLMAFRRRGGNIQTILFVGNDLSLKRIYQTIVQVPTSGYRVMGYYADERMVDEPNGLKYLGDFQRLSDKMDEEAEKDCPKSSVDELFCSLPPAQAETIHRLVTLCNQRLIHFYYVPQAFENYGVQLRPVQFAGYPVYANYASPLLRISNRLCKRLFDIAFSAVVCLFLLPITLVVGIVIKLQSPGPIFFLQKRTGMNGREFYCYKFRSMHVNKDADKVQCTENDPRKFAFGDLMRRTNIDELPQFFNVLKGDMSIVGPRPHMLMHTTMYAKLINNYMARLFCKPGITGWAQVSGYRGETKELWQMEGRVNHDIWYMEHWSFWLDMRIIGKTIAQTIVHDKNAY